ncbi:hypothetical protein PQQ59_17465 [Paraburkholderia aspalathi]|uniref:helix-turn-helix transcriptional regulator n=1 Tax=Paraburkholderia aspalathi TaxID=1324617 RepID=UPI0038B92722
MGISFSNPEALAGAKTVVSTTTGKSAPVKQKRPPRSGNTKPRPLLFSLDQPGRLRVGHLLTLLSISSPTLYKRINTGEIPKPDGRMGRSPYWNTQTVREYLAGGKVTGGG